jgi:hypothetical protein
LLVPAIALVLSVYAAYTRGLGLAALAGALAAIGLAYGIGVRLSWRIAIGLLLAPAPALAFFMHRRASVDPVEKALRVEREADQHLFVHERPDLALPLFDRAARMAPGFIPLVKLAEARLLSGDGAGAHRAILAALPHDEDVDTEAGAMLETARALLEGGHAELAWAALEQARAGAAPFDGLR